MNFFQTFLDSIKGKKVLVCGMGRSNEFIIKRLFEFGTELAVYDSKEEKKIEPKILDYIKSKNIEHWFGKSDVSGIDCDVIIRTPGMNYLSKGLVEARRKGIIVTSEMEIFFDLCPCEIIGITGSDGKTTVTTIISKILENSGKNVFVGGNIGLPLLPRLDSVKEDDVVVAELSSFQLISMRKSPNVAVITNLSPNHLDVHTNMEEYVNAKENIILHQGAFGRAVLNFDDEMCRNMQQDAHGQTLFFSRKAKVGLGTWVDGNGNIFFSYKNQNTFVMNKNDIKIVGEHNLENYLAAISAVWEYADIGAICETAKKFSGVEHRIEFVRELNGVSYYNDSIATSPTRVIKGCLSVFDKKIILIAGGYDKNIPFDELGNAICQKVKTLILTGKASQKIETAVKNSANFASTNLVIIKAESLKIAVEEAFKNASSGDIVALSPACASFDSYKNFEERGQDFKRLVNALELA